MTSGQRASSGVHGSGAIITGGSRGIGLAVAHRLVARGIRVMLVARDETKLQTAVADLNRKRANAAQYLVASIDGQQDTAQGIVDQADGAVGPIRFLLNAAGGATVADGLTVPMEIWRQDFDVKFWGYLSMMRAMMPVMTGHGGGVIVNILGVAGKDPNPRLPIAGAINGALRNVTKVFSDLGARNGIRIVNVNPGATDTDLLQKMAEGFAKIQHRDIDTVLSDMRNGGPLGRLPTADDIAQCVEFLMSPAAGLITGTSIDIDGGVHRGPA